MITFTPIFPASGASKEHWPLARATDLLQRARRLIVAALTPASSASAGLTPGRVRTN